MATFDGIGFDLETPPDVNLDKVQQNLDTVQNKVNNLESDLKDAIISSSPPSIPSGIKVPAKIFDPLFGPNVIFGHVLTSDFMAFCDYKPLARVGDLVFVVGIVGITIVAEIGVITSGCMDVRNNSIGSGTPFPGGPGTGSLLGGCNGQKESNLYKSNININLLNESILNRIDPCINSGDLVNCLPSIVQDILSLCDSDAPNLGYGAVNDFKLESVIQKLGYDYITKLNKMLQNGFCGNPKLEVNFSSNSNSTDPSSPCYVLEVDSKPGDAAMSLPIQKNKMLPNGVAGGASTLNAQCVSDHMNYLSNKIDGTTQFSDSLGDHISKHDLELISLTKDIENYYQKLYITDVRNKLIIFPDEFPENSEEAINLAFKIYDDLFDPKDNADKTMYSYKNIVEDMKSLKNKIQSIAEDPLTAISDYILSDPQLKRFWGELVNEMNDSLASLKPPPPEGVDVCSSNTGIFDNDGNVLTGCSELANLQKEVRDNIAGILELVNGKPGKSGLIATSMGDLGVSDIRKTTGAAGMNPIDSMTLFRLEAIDKVKRCMRQTAKTKSQFEKFEKTSYTLSGKWGMFSAVFAASPRNILTGDLLDTNGLTEILKDIKEDCLTLPQTTIKKFALEVSDMLDDIRDFNFVSHDPDVVAISPSLSSMLNDPSILIPASNIGMILSAAQNAISQALGNAALIRQQLSTIFPSKEQMLDEMMSYVDNIVKMGIDSLKSLQGCFPPLPCFSFDGFKFDFDLALKLGIGFPFKLKIPVLDFAFPNLDFKMPIVFPTIVAPTGFKIALNISLPNIKFPRIPNIPPFPPNIYLPTIRLPNLRFPLDLSRLNKLIPKFPKVSYTVPLPQFKLPRFKGIRIPSVNVRLPHIRFNLKFGSFPFPKLNIQLPKFPIKIGFHMPITFNVKVPIPSISLKLPQLPKFPILNIPKITLQVPKININFSGGLSFGSITLPKISIPFPAITIPSLCGDKGKTVDELIADGKNIYNRILNMGISGGRPGAVANCSMWVSPHFHGWIAPIPCSANMGDFSKCMCLI
jgi:hypothetical protein